MNTARFAEGMGAHGEELVRVVVRPRREGDEEKVVRGATQAELGGLGRVSKRSARCARVDIGVWEDVAYALECLVEVQSGAFGVVF